MKQKDRKDKTEDPQFGTCFVLQVFLGKLPEDLYEDELIPLMEKCGKIYELRVIVDKEGYNRGFGFVTFCDKESAKNAVNTYANYRYETRYLFVSTPEGSRGYSGFENIMKSHAKLKSANVR